MCRWMIHRSRLAHRSWSVGTTSGEGSAEVGRNFRCKDGSGRREDELLCDNTEERLSEAYMQPLARLSTKRRNEP